jgi:UDPglucose 6-dehydrogenase
MPVPPPDHPSQPAQTGQPPAAGSRIAVVGSGYVGTVVAACFAHVGHQVVGVEVDPQRLGELQAGRVPFYEDGLEPLLADGLAAGRLRFTDDTSDAMRASDVVFLCVGTPAAPDGRPDMRAVEAAARAAAEASDGRHVLVTKSTVPIGSGSWLLDLVEEASGAQLRVVSNPEFLREGSAVDDFLHPDRVVLGSDDPGALALVAETYRPILEQRFPGGEPALPPLVRTRLATAETVKYAANAFLATKISFINEIANICELVGADVVEVATAIGLDARIGPRFLEAGLGWGGSCFGKDLSALASIAGDYGYQADLLDAVIAVNQRQRALVVEKLQRELKILRGRRIGLLGVAFKPGTDDTRDAPALDLAHRLDRHGATVVGFDPLVDAVPGSPLTLVADPTAVADRADALVVTTDWPELLSLDLPALNERMRGDLFLDARNMFDARTVESAGLRYEAMGRHQPAVLAGTGA